MDENKKPKCCGEVIANSAGGKDFWFCRGCKNEVLTFNPLISPFELNEEEIDDTISRLQKILNDVSNWQTRPLNIASDSFVNAGHLHSLSSSDCMRCHITYVEWITKNRPKCPIKTVYDPFLKITRLGTPSGHQFIDDKEYD